MRFLKISGVAPFVAGVLLMAGCSEGSPEVVDVSPPEKAPAESQGPAVREAAVAPPAQAAPAPGPPILSLEQLLDIGEAAPPPRGLDLEARADDAEPDAALLPKSPVDVLRDHTRVRHESGAIGVEGVREQRVGVAEAGVAVPVNEEDSVRLRGGVRVDYETDDGVLVEEPEPIPTVGVEVRF